MMDNLNLQSNPQTDQHQQVVGLACQACQRKKIKCDRRSPCGQCQASKLSCSPSIRKPRARHAGKRAIDSELRNRISKLEGLVESLSGEGSSQNVRPNAETERVAKVSDADAASPIVGRYIGSPFWSSLTIEVQALRDALEEDEAEEEAESQSPPPSSGGINGDSSNAEYDLIMCRPGTIYIMPGALNEPSPQMAESLYSAFISRVAPLFKGFHVPTLQAFLERGHRYAGLDADSVPNRALKASVWYASISAMSDDQCRRSYGESRNDLARRFRRCADVLFSQANLIDTNDFSTLQALVTYLFALRRFEPSRRVWTLVALAVRIAHAMKLHLELPGRMPFETEIRRRLWHQIRFLDVFIALDRGTEFLITPVSHDTPLPTNVNDSDIGESSTSIVPRDTGITDMTFPLMVYEATLVTQRLNTPELSPKGDTWERRLELAEDFVARIHDKYLQYVNPAVPWHRLIRNVGGSVCSGMILRAVRPMQRHLSSVPPRVDSPYVLQMAVNCLEQGGRMNADRELEPWLWALVWVQWHPLAVALAGLCSIRDTELADRAWRSVDGGYTWYSKNVADSTNGMLWRPIEKLYKKASAFRDEGRQLSSTSPGMARRNGGMPANSDPSHSQAVVGISHPSSTAAGLDNPLTTSVQMPLPATLTAGLPMDALSTGPVDLSSVDSAFPDLQMHGPNAGDMSSWLDWEGIMDDFSAMDAEQIDLGDLQPPEYLLQGSDWPRGVHQDLM